MQLSEKFLYHIWDAQHLKEELQTVSGKNLKIMFQGSWNTNAGADFKNAVLQIDGEVVRGDIEAHRKTYDWNSHKHHENSNFNTVILHIVFEHNGKYSYTINENGDRIEILEIRNYLDQEVAKLSERYREKKFVSKEKFCTFFGGLDQETLELFLQKMGKNRLEKKIKRFSAELYFSDFNQLLYQGIFEALGYSKNKFQMLQIALNFPYSDLKEFYKNAMTKDELISIWLGSSDLINHLPASFPTEYKNKWKEIYSTQNHSTKPVELDWNLFRIRPVNNAGIRIIQISGLIYNNLDLSLFNSMLKLFSAKRGQHDLKELYQRLYSFFQIDSEYLPENYKIGKTRIDTIFINIVLPLTILYARKMSYPELESAALYYSENFKGLQGNYIIDRMSDFMNEEQRKLIRKKAIFQQGILKLYFDSCIHHNCNSCEILKRKLLGEM